MSWEQESLNLRKAVAEKVAGDMSTSPTIGSPDRGGSSRCRALDLALGVLIAAVPLVYSGLARASLKWAILGVLVPVISFLWLWRGCGRPFRPLPRLLAPLLALLLVMGVSLFHAINVHYGLQRMAFVLILIFLYLIVAYCHQAARQDLLIGYLLLTLLVVSGLSLCGCATGFLLTSATPVRMVVRLFGNTNYGAAYLLTIVPLAFAAYLNAPHRVEKGLYGTTVFLSMALLTFLMVRGAWISIWVGLWAVVWVYFRRERGQGTIRDASPRSQIGPLLLVGSAVILALALWPLCMPEAPSVAERVFGTSDPTFGSLQMRLAFWRGTVQLIRDHLWTGIGIGNFALAFVPYRTPVIYRSPTVQIEHPHNEYLNVWAELGPLGVLAFAWLLISVIRLVWALLGRSGVRRGVLAGILGGLAASAAYANLFYVVHAPASAMNVAILLGLLDGMDGEVIQGVKRPTVRLRVLIPALLLMGLLWFQYFLAPLAGEFHYFLAQRDFRDERMDQGLRRLERSLEWNPQSYVVRYRRATALLSQERYPETIHEARKALQVHPNLEIAYLVIGNAYLKLGEKPKAKAMFLKALDINPHYPHALNNLGIRAVEEGRLAEAEALFLRAAEGLGRGYVSPYVNLANLYESTGHVEAALQMYETAVTIEPNSGSHWYHMARLRALTGDLREAYEPLARAIALDEAWRARAAKESAFAAMRESDSRVRVLLRLQ